jgi:hypothetical protein
LSPMSKGSRFTSPVTPMRTVEPVVEPWHSGAKAPLRAPRREMVRHMCIVYQVCGVWCVGRR